MIEARSLDYTNNPWGTNGLDCDLELLNQLIATALEAGIQQESGRFAKAFDSWSAVELRRTGFPVDSVWPRQSMPRVLTRELELLLGTLTPKARRDELRNWLTTNSKSAAIAPAKARVLGGVYWKQADVLIADWSAGVEVMISTKSMLGIPKSRQRTARPGQRRLHASGLRPRAAWPAAGSGRCSGWHARGSLRLRVFDEVRQAG